ncbi:MAG: DUF2271 domain-containing protein [Saprospiraceae bacterium]
MRFILVLLLFNLIINTPKLNSQTPGTMTFSFTNPVPATTAKQNVFAIWIEDENGNFVRTLCRFWSNSTNDHLPSWKSSSNQNTVDAITGATLSATTVPTAFGDKTINWNGKNADGNTVDDGTYKVLVESSWCNPQPSFNQHKFLSSFTFEKATSSTNITHEDDNLDGVTISWEPNPSGITENSSQKLYIYPNPVKHLLNYNITDSKNIQYINIVTTDGKIVDSKNLSLSNKLSNQIDISNLKNGMYYLEIILDDNNILMKPFIVDK